MSYTYLQFLDDTQKETDEQMEWLRKAKAVEDEKSLEAYRAGYLQGAVMAAQLLRYKGGFKFKE